VGAELFHADRRTDRHNEAVALKFCNRTKKHIKYSYSIIRYLAAVITELVEETNSTAALHTLLDFLTSLTPEMFPFLALIIQMGHDT
jgi:hypothetical protein